ncbi:MAG: diacylglycerol kinase family lipid kinase [Lachnospiraceae bacterium]|nr:diacylglycerol kinase family lipid kinase [Lachnospiraceae bacterium]
MEKTFHFILNPVSRSGKGRKLWDTVIEPYLQAARVRYEAHFSREAGDITRLSREITSTQSTELCHIVVLGGDGTIDEALQGISDLSRVALGYIPIGSGNDFTRDMPIPRDPLKALKRILEADKTTAVDIGTTTYEDGSSHRFIVSSGIGFDAAVCEETNRSEMKGFLNRIGLGKLTYLGIALKQLFASRAVSCQIRLDGGEPISIRKILFVAFMNHMYEGGGFKFAPRADYRDGLLDLCVVGDLSKALILLALPTAFMGRHYMFRGITAYRAHKVEIQTSAPLWVHTDGEVARRSNRLVVTCQRRALQMYI